MIEQLQNFLTSQDERELSAVPVPVLVALVLGIALQLAWHSVQDKPVARASDLSPPPALSLLEVASLGDQVALSRLLMLRLQAFDNQPGISVPFKELDYAVLTEWLEAISLLDRQSQYPFLSAARVYAKVLDDEKKRQMLDFVHRGFLENPNRRWPAMAHAVFIAKHRLKDLDLALELARDLRIHASGPGVPPLVRQMELFVLEDIGDIESAKILLGSFLESGVIRDQRELDFLKQRLGVQQQD